MHPLTSYLYDLMHLKRSNLCVSADVTTTSAMLTLAEAVGPSIVVFKTHADILSNWDADPHTGTGAKLAAIARRYRFLIFEDRKFADIGFTVQLQYSGGDYRIREWAHVVNAHILPGEDVVRALKERAFEWAGCNEGEDGFEGVDERFEGIEEPPRERGLLLLAQMSSKGNFLDEEYTRNCVSIARKHQDFVMGFIALQPVSEPEEPFIVMTPGCALSREESLDGSEFPSGEKDTLGQQYVHPRELILRGSDIIIVGTGICNAVDPAAKAEQYRKVAWKAYEEGDAPNEPPVVWLPSME
ncbi:Ribulose-phosphate binding barrel [Glarea lozoyensis ATCC 20868]|uniref:Orotidine 5'-phosphate decarboxylase n=1 Tax=Glarea lozoyensis (strain ATCC 20868 / MF5171) TaxID=1116229 RepID=S3DRC2_GLAL2|nr:Ribulose-phosphate binding barrel [Glarea lozoyensis ATCC 20868]EPE34561.1 Ribulose-phosphate binding barrel [Glarea lozoyensis ATCC 20868]